MGPRVHFATFSSKRPPLLMSSIASSATALEVCVHRINCNPAQAFCLPLQPIIVAISSRILAFVVFFEPLFRGDAVCRFTVSDTITRLPPAASTQGSISILPGCPTFPVENILPLAVSLPRCIFHLTPSHVCQQLLSLSGYAYTI